ncbi:MAG: O-antigen translocase [Rubrivivax sp.]|nr:O-antigen translocase [Rubrivivax sp.]
MTLFRTSVLSALSVLTKLATSLYLSKVLAVYVGPAGYGIIGQFQSLVSMVTTFASGATNSGVTKYTAEYADAPMRQQIVWATAATIGLGGAVLFGLLLALFRQPLSSWLLGTEQYASVFVWLAASLSFLVLNGLLLAILNGRKAVRELVTANIVGSLTGALLATLLVRQFGLLGALIALAINQAAAFVFTAWLFQRTTSTKWRTLLGRIDGGVAKSLGGFALMAATTALVVPIGQILIRDQIAGQLGWDTAGLWQALCRISETHLLLLTSTLSVYFLPRFSEIKSGRELHHEVMSGYRFVVPVVLASAIGLYLFREGIVRLLLTADFLPLTQVLGLQLVGDALKICSWLMAFTMISHARTKVFIVTEVVFTVMYVVATIFLSRQFGLLGTSMAYAGVYLLYWITMYWLLRDLVTQLDRTQRALSPQVENRT